MLEIVKSWLENISIRIFEFDAKNYGYRKQLKQLYDVLSTTYLERSREKIGILVQKQYD